MSTESKNSKSVIIIFGPTASGKTELLLKLFNRRAEVINADSMQVYKYLDIGTAKPDPQTRSVLPHHLIDIKDPKEQFNAGEFVRLADKLVGDIINRGKIPVISGGTAFYLRNFIYGLPESPPGNRKVRETLKVEARKKGLSALYRELKEKDRVTAEKISPGDSYRIIRALEVIRQTGKPLSSFRIPETPRKGYSLLPIGLGRDRIDLYNRINSRVEKMFSMGLSKEIIKLMNMGYSEEDPGMQGIGYREFFIMQKSGCITMTGVKDLIKRNSRRYARRQITFFKRLPEVIWIHPREEEKILKLVDTFLVRN
ncbi:MAG: tRNA (adenosine(37)-N6)-dimethylallyltransferase MiaA [Spirochaetes bacterium]|nr:MAG: tRNA (adenosine(37)-N6)-dimethylallyltransferase MiaA [Spirochaetota bacterium]